MPISLEEAHKIVKKLPTYLIPTGSYIRKSEIINDLDFLTTKDFDFVFEDLSKIIPEINQNLIKMGTKYLSFHLPEYEINIDIWKTKPENLFFAVICSRSFKIL